MPEKFNTIAEIVRNDYRSAEVFKKYGINFCCSGMVSLEDACVSRNLNSDDVIAELKEASRTITLSHSLQFDQWKVSFLLDYIINVHHAYVQVSAPLLETRLTAFITDHKKRFPELEEILVTFVKLKDVLEKHIRQEDEVMFPYIRQIDAALSRKESYGNLFVRTLRKPLGNFQKEHNAITELLQKLSSVTNNYTPPPKACINHQVIYYTLKEFHDDLVQHKHLENNILFPKAIEIERQLLLI